MERKIGLSDLKKKLNTKLSGLGRRMNLEGAEGVNVIKSHWKKSQIHNSLDIRKMVKWDALCTGS